MKKIKIMHIINNLEVGGAEKMLVLLTKELSKRDDVEIYVVSLEGHGPLKIELSNKVQLKEFKYHLFWNRLINKLNPNFRFRLYLYVKQIKPDIIHGHLIKGEDFAKVLGCIIDVPVITTSHDALIRPSRKTKRLNRFLLTAVAVSDFVAKHLQSAYGLTRDKIKVIPNAIETELFKKGKKKFDIKKPVFIYIGRLLESKGIDDVIKGLAGLLPKYPDMEFLIYGKEVFPEYKRSLQRLVEQNNWDFVKFMGRTDDVPAALAKGDIFVLSSQSEGFAISVLEAAAASKPIIATKTGAIPDMVTDKKSGILIEWGHPEQIYDAAAKILDNNLVDKYGEQSRLTAQNNFSVKMVERMYYDLYIDTFTKSASNSRKPR